MRAFGLVNGDVDLVASMGTLEDEGTLAYDDPDTERITVRGTEMTPALRVTWSMVPHVVQDSTSISRLDGFDSSDLEAGSERSQRVTQRASRTATSTHSTVRTARRTTTPRRRSQTRPAWTCQVCPTRPVADFGRRRARHGPGRPSRADGRGQGDQPGVRPAARLGGRLARPVSLPRRRCGDPCPGACGSRRVRRRWPTATWARSHSSCFSRDSSIRMTRSMPSTRGRRRLRRLHARRSAACESRL